jgi:hypothetical protein
MFGREQSRDATLHASMAGKLQGTADRVQSEAGDSLGDGDAARWLG